jgi:ribonuclease P/MRP protein subunit RPP1
MTMEAGALGFDTIVLPMEQPAVIGNVSVLPARVIETRHVREVIRDLGRTKEGQVVIVMAGDASFIRGVVPLRGVDLLAGVERQRKNAFDHVSARLAAEKNVGVTIDLFPLLHLQGLQRQRVLQRYADLLTLHRRYEFPFVIGSFARSILDQRSVREMTLLCALFGMEKEEALRGLTSLPGVLHPLQPVRVVE